MRGSSESIFQKQCKCPTPHILSLNNFVQKSRKQSIFCYFLRLILKLLPVLSLHCCTWAFFSCSEPGLLFIAVCGLLTEMASLVVEHKF